jgi:hypothetical protein
MTLTYNDLPPVEYASDQLSSKVAFPSFLSEFATLAHAAGVTHIVGAFLLHRHFLLRAHEDICEQFLNLNGAPALSSAPVAHRPANQLPHRWALAGGDWLPLEFSNDSAVANNQRLLVEFMPAFESLLLKFELDKWVGLALTARAALQPSPGEVYFEETTAAASVVTCVKDVGNIHLFINTLWAPDPTSPQMRCHQTQRCRREGYPPNDRHSYLMGHDHEQG